MMELHKNSHFTSVYQMIVPKQNMDADWTTNALMRVLFLPHVFHNHNNDGTYILAPATTPMQMAPKGLHAMTNPMVEKFKPA